VQGSAPLLGSLSGTGHQEGASFLLFLRDEAARSGRPVPEGVSVPYTGIPDPYTRVVSKRPRPFSTGIALGWMIPVGSLKEIYRTGPNVSCRFTYRHRRQWGEISVGLLGGMQIIMGKETSIEPGVAEKYDMDSWPVTATFSYVNVFDPPIYATVEVAAGAAINRLVYHASAPQDDREIITAKPYLGSAIGLGLRFLDRLYVTAYGRFVSILFNESAFLGISPEISLEYAY
jgi:hypothetical protein